MLVDQCELSNQWQNKRRLIQRFHADKKTPSRGARGLGTYTHKGTSAPLIDSLRPAWFLKKDPGAATSRGLLALSEIEAGANSREANQSPIRRCALAIIGTNAAIGSSYRGGAMIDHAGMSFHAAAEECRRLAAKTTDPVEKQSCIVLPTNG